VSILQEYLIKLGFAADEPSMQKFLGVISKVGGATAEVGTTAVETATAIGLMVSRVARHYETLYYVSSRTGHSVRYIQSTQQAFKSIGLGAEDATASIESMGSTLRQQPWLRAIFGGASTPQAVASKLGRSGLPYFLQARFAEMIGMDEKTLFHLQKFAAAEESMRKDFERRQRDAGIDPDKWAKRLGAPEPGSFAWSLNRLEGSLEIFGQRMALDFVDPVQKGIDKVSVMVDWLNRLDVASKGWLGTLEGIAGTVGGLWAVERVLRFMVGAKGTSSIVGGAVGTAIGAGGLSRYVGGGLRGAVKSSWLLGGYAALSTVKENNPETRRSLRTSLGPLMYELGLSTTPDLNDESGTHMQTLRRMRGRGGRGGGLGGRSAVERYIVEAAVRRGIDPQVALAVARSEGLYGYVGDRGSSFGPYQLHYGGMAGGGMAQKGLGDEFTKKTGLDARDQSTTRSQIDFALDWAKSHGWGAWHGWRGSQWAGIDVADKLSNQAAGHNAPVTQNVTLNQNTTIRVEGSGSDDAAGKVLAAQGEVNSNLVRNVQGAIR